MRFLLFPLLSCLAIQTSLVRCSVSSNSGDGADMLPETIGSISSNGSTGAMSSASISTPTRPSNLRGSSMFNSTIPMQVRSLARMPDLDHFGRKLINTVVITVGSNKPSQPLAQCQGDCDNDGECAGNLVCYQRDRGDPVPGCVPPAAGENSMTDYCVKQSDITAMQNNNNNNNQNDKLNTVHGYKSGDPKLLLCQGDCNTADDCVDGLVCQQRNGGEEVRGCVGGSNEPSKTDYCALPDPNAATTPFIVSSSQKHSNSGLLTLPSPSKMAVGDLLVLFLSRTDDPLPLSKFGWDRQAMCLKQSNGNQCITEQHPCIQWYQENNKFCQIFRYNNVNWNGEDLGTVVFTRTVTQVDINRPSYFFNLIHKNPTWAIMTVIRGADTNNPIRSHAETGCDNINRSRFPSTYGVNRDLLLMSMAFDDTVTVDKFLAPSSSQFVSYIYGPDEAGFLYAETLTKTGMTGERTTQGVGASGCKDANISIVIRAKGA